MSFDNDADIWALGPVGIGGAEFRGLSGGELTPWGEILAEVEVLNYQSCVRIGTQTKKNDQHDCVSAPSLLLFSSS